MGRYYILRDGKVLEESDYQRWAEWFEGSYEDTRCIAHTELGHGTVTTEFLAISLGLGSDSPPLLFETRVKGGWLDSESERYATLSDALKGHETWVSRVRVSEEENQLPPPGAGW